MINFFLSLLIVGFGQPNLSPGLAMMSAVFGFALFFSLLLHIPSPKKRFWFGTLWFSLVQMIQLFWSLGHPFYYIYIVYALYVFLLGLQFGLLSYFITPEKIKKFSWILGIAGLWVLLEWSRLFFFSGHPWNPAGLSFGGNLYSRQFASLMGIYGLSFWVIFANLAILRAARPFSLSKAALASVITAVPFIYGFVHLKVHSPTDKNQVVKTALVQTNFPIEEAMSMNQGEFLHFIQDEWKQILKLVKKVQNEKVDMLVLPELVVPYGTYFLVFDYEETVKAFHDILGPESVDKLPRKWQHLAMEVNGKWMVNNAFWVQGIANVLEAGVISGLEDRDYHDEGDYKNYTAAYLFRPHIYSLERYEKRVLVPMGEYIPFKFLQNLAAKYGVAGSFSCGTSSKVFQGCKIPVGISICYEENFGHMMRENRLKGAEMLVNITNDGWFPRYGLAKSHLEHARFRTVEMGIPLIRACNTGVTCALNSFGEEIAVLGKTPKEQETLQDVLIADVPRHAYFTPYAYLGDYPIVAASAFFFLFAAFGAIRKR